MLFCVPTENLATAQWSALEVLRGLSDARWMRREADQAPVNGVLPGLTTTTRGACLAPRRRASLLPVALRLAVSLGRAASSLGAHTSLCAPGGSRLLNRGKPRHDHSLLSRGGRGWSPLCGGGRSRHPRTA